ncbi:MAG: Exodeoxyribonuclease 7 small subunit [Candidatus Moanabacter tarae]|uniref:Exodeoxyribonuclease 7 small subunit n=1 Tax=Candidatus Moanibacter tarae TaxID=2200854 RepID=A0A2Z4AFG3_9BACT|nr:MAG: Exodeoxyribonuclease 7 small subunit [Candidatus Moanabacter tarae]|tara:strand:+ start:13890 stop:14135 length:246 start_codon:yes stop_codon:yes gene_type:complete
MSGKENKDQSFEEALANLESIIDSMEKGETPLGELVEKFEEGTKLLKTCQKQIKDAELRIEILKEETNETNIDKFELDPEQ